jgi:hypothetical protein
VEEVMSMLHFKGEIFMAGDKIITWMASNTEG